MIDVLDVAQMDSWKVVKRWQAHDGPIESLTLDPRSLWTVSRLSLSLPVDGSSSRSCERLRPLNYESFLLEMTDTFVSS